MRRQVAAAREKLGDKAGVPEVADRFVPIPKEARWLTWEEVRPAFVRAHAKLEQLRWWKIGLDPTRTEHALREPAAVVAGGVEAFRAKLEGAERSLMLAREAGDFLLWAQAQAGTGVFPFPAVRGGKGAAFVAAERFLARAEREGKIAEFVRHGWVFDDGADGGLQFDNGEAGVAMFELYEVTHDEKYLTSARRAADWAEKHALVRNWNYNSFSVHLLAKAFAVTGERHYLEAATRKALVGVLPGQLTDGPHAGRWLDAHNARPAYHYIMMTALAELAGVLPEEHPARPEIVAALRLGLRARNQEILGPGASNKDKAVEALIVVSRVFAADAAFLGDSLTTGALDALGRLVSEQSRRGTDPLGPHEWGMFLAFAAARSAPPTRVPATSLLWGEHGEKWDAAGRLPDFSYAGYHRGETPIPDVPQVAGVKDFGAIGDGVADDTKAIQAAIDATKRGAVFVPPGRYKISDYLRIEKSGVVLRGAGPTESVLWFPRGLDEVHPRAGRTSTGSAASGYSFDGAFVTVQGDYQATTLAKIVATARRGEREVQVDHAAGLAVGQAVLVALRETREHSLKTFLYSGDPGDIRQGKQLDTKMLLRITAVSGDRVQFDRALRFDTRAEWQPEIRRFAPTVTESGIEELGFEFPATKYGGHFKENGANAIELRQVHDCWVRHVAIRNGDISINVVACGNTIDGVTITAEASRGTREAGIDCTGHHGIQCKSAEDNFVTNFDFRTSYVHDLSVEHASGNVFAHGRGDDLCFDHHKDSPYENLYTDIDCGRGNRVWRCGGGASLGRQSAGWETFWNITAAQPIAPPPKGWGPSTMNFVGLKTTAPATVEAAGTWWETAPASDLTPRDLHAAQLQRRLARPQP